MGGGGGVGVAVGSGVDVGWGVGEGVSVAVGNGVDVAARVTVGVGGWASLSATPCRTRAAIVASTSGVGVRAGVAWVACVAGTPHATLSSTATSTIQAPKTRF